MDERLATLQQAILAQDKEGALEATRTLLDSQISPRVILESGLAAAMLELGRRWKCGEAFLPEVVVSADIFARCSELVEPALLENPEEARPSHRLVLATVKGDLHDLGKNIVGAMAKTVGFEVKDLGKNVPADEIVAAAREHSPCIVGLSALLTTTMPQQRVAVEAIDDAGLRPGVKVIVGGAPVTQSWADQIGADGYAPDAASAAELARSLVA
ncbi:MAG: cobalamin-dependent protein [Gemmatimonadota bacterium]|nr:MAG: cobalamin-dependent protein [Gemmatimonadota bacterium]